MEGLQVAIPPRDSQKEVRNSIHSELIRTSFHCRHLIFPPKCYTPSFWVPGIENPAFMPEMEVPPPPWLTEAENDTSVAPSQRAQRQLPWSPNNLRRLAPLRISNQSTDSFLMADAPPTEESLEDPFEEPPKRDDSHL